MNKKEKKFWLLLDRYEQLVTEERFALSHHNFEYLNTVIDEKQNIIGVLEKLEKEIDKAYCKEIGIGEKIETVCKEQSKNRELFDSLLKEIQEKGYALRRERNRVVGIKNSYVLHYPLVETTS